MGRAACGVCFGLAFEEAHENGFHADLPFSRQGRGGPVGDDLSPDHDDDPPRRTEAFADPPRACGPAEVGAVGLVVAHGGPALGPSADSFGSGIVSRTQVPTPGVLSIASAPPKCPARSRMPMTP